MQQLSGEPHNLAINVGRGSGQSQDRWRQTLTPVGDDGLVDEKPDSPIAVTTSTGHVAQTTPRHQSPVHRQTSEGQGQSTNGDSRQQDIEDLVRRVEVLENRIASLERERQDPTQ